jgi:hypothetical protein
MENNTAANNKYSVNGAIFRDEWTAFGYAELNSGLNPDQDYVVLCGEEDEREEVARFRNGAIEVASENPSGAAILEAIETPLRAGAVDEWDAPEFERARKLTEQAGCVWDFVGWRATAATIRNHGRLGGVRLA